MAFTEKTLTLIAHGSGNQVFQYVTNDDLATVKGTGYFATDLLKKGDVILTSLDLDGTPAFTTLMASAVASGVATVVEATVSSCEACKAS